MSMKQYPMTSFACKPASASKGSTQKGWIKQASPQATAITMRADDEQQRSEQ